VLHPEDFWGTKDLQKEFAGEENSTTRGGEKSLPQKYLKKKTGGGGIGDEKKGGKGVGGGSTLGWDYVPGTKGEKKVKGKG